MSRLVLLLAAVSLEIFPADVGAQDVAVQWGQRLVWTNEDGPEAREHGAIVVDQGRARALLIGGSGYSPYLSPLDDVWQLDLKNLKWTRVESVQAAPAGGSRRAASLPERKLAYLFGGYDAQANPNNELYRVDYGGDVPTFTAIVQENPPPPRSLHAFAYDSQSDRFFLFGGIGKDNQVLGDTWSLRMNGDRADWTKLAVTTSPSPRYGFFYGFDTRQGKLVVFSGGQNIWPIDPAQDTWGLDTRADPPTWKLLIAADAPNVPPGRRNGCGVFDDDRQRLFVFGGTADGRTSEVGLFALDIRGPTPSWARLNVSGAPPLRSSGFGFYDQDRQRILLGFGNTTMEPYRDFAPLILSER